MKTLYDQVEEELAAIEGEEPVVVDKPVTDEPAAEEDEPAPEESVVEPAAPEEPKQSPEDFIKIRQEVAEMKRIQREANEAAQRAIELQKQPKAVEDPEPNPAEDMEAHLAWENRQIKKQLAEVRSWKEQQEQVAQRQQTIQGAIQEFQGYEQNFKLKAPDYDDAANFFQQKVKESISTLQPQLTDAQVAQAAANQLLQMGSTFVNQGLDPAEAIYNIAKRQGFTKAEAPKTETKPSKPSLETIQKNKSKSANGLGAGAGSKTPVTIAEIEKSSVLDMYGISDEEIYKAMYK